MSCEEFEELLGAYVLEALSEDERQAADKHLAECATCARDVQQLQAVVDLFPFSLPAVDPPPRLKAQIFARIRASQDLMESPIRPDKALSGRGKRRRDFALLAAAILLLLVVVGGMLAWNLSLRQQVSQLSARVPPPITYVIHGTGTSPTAIGEAIYYPQQKNTVLIMHGLPQLTGTHVYQGWLLRGTHTTSIGLFNIQNGVATLDFQGSLSGYDAAAVSLENGPLASRNAPKGPVIAVGSLKS